MLLSKATYHISNCNKSYLSNSNQGILYARTMQITTDLLYLVNHACIKCQTSRTNLKGAVEFLF